MAEAVSYVLRQWRELTVFAADELQVLEPSARVITNYGEPFALAGDTSARARHSRRYINTTQFIGQSMSAIVLVFRRDGMPSPFTKRELLVVDMTWRSFRVDNVVAQVAPRRSPRLAGTAR
jgi:hypothetical protein